MVGIFDFIVVEQVTPLTVFTPPVPAETKTLSG